HLPLRRDEPLGRTRNRDRVPADRRTLARQRDPRQAPERIRAAGRALRAGPVPPRIARRWAVRRTARSRHPIRRVGPGPVPHYGGSEPGARPPPTAAPRAP